jgi:CheY-like chemotaxis protein
MGARILVADDSVTIQKVVELTFSREDFTLIQARSGEEAIRKAKEAHPDLILLDLVMPDKNGYEVCAILRAEPSLRSVPIIFLTGTFETYDQERGAQVGANDYVTKPFESQVLVGKVKQLLFAKTVDAGVPPPAAPAFTRLAAETVTVKIPSVGTPAAPPKAPPVEPPAPPPKRPEPAPPAAAPKAELTQDDLWQLLEAPSSTAPAPETEAPAPAELRLEDLGAPAPPAASEMPALELGTLEPEPAVPAPETEALAPAPPAEASSFPESLSLDDLLAGGPAPGAPVPAPAEGGVAGAAGIETALDLPSDEGIPPLPMVEAGTGAPPAFSMDDLLAPAPEPAAGEGSPLQMAEFDLAALQEEAGAPSAPAAPSGGLEAAIGIPLEELEASALEPMAASPAAPPAPVEVPPAMEEFAASAEAAMPTAEETAPVAEEAAEAPASAEASLMRPTATAELRQAVTERVAQDLARELTEKLVERIEKIVWEVVPDLAEILIMKEIERLRRMAEDEKSA